MKKQTTEYMRGYALIGAGLALLWAFGELSSYVIAS